MRERFAELEGRLFDFIDPNGDLTPEDVPHDIEEAAGRGRERFNLKAAIVYGRVMIPFTLAMAVIAFAPGGSQNIIEHLPKVIKLGIGTGIALSVLFGLEKRRYLSDKIHNLPVS